MLSDMATYSEGLVQNGSLVISGFYDQDISALKEKAYTCGLEFVSEAQELEWRALEFKKR